MPVVVVTEVGVTLAVVCDDRSLFTLIAQAESRGGFVTHPDGRRLNMAGQDS